MFNNDSKPTKVPKHLFILPQWTTETVEPICDPDIKVSAGNGKTYQYSQKVIVMQGPVLRKVDSTIIIPPV